MDEGGVLRWSVAERVDRGDQRTDRAWSLRKPCRAHDHDAVMIVTIGSVLAVEPQKIVPVVGHDRALLSLRHGEKLRVDESAQLDSFLYGADVGPAIA